MIKMIGIDVAHKGRLSAAAQPKQSKRACYNNIQTTN